MSNSVLSLLLIPAFAALYAGGICNSAIICSVGLTIMAFITANVLFRKK